MAATGALCRWRCAVPDPALQHPLHRTRHSRVAFLRALRLLHFPAAAAGAVRSRSCPDHRTPRARQSARSEEHTSELQSLMRISYAVFCLKKKKTTIQNNNQDASNNNKQILNKTTINLQASYITHTVHQTQILVSAKQHA